MSDRVILSNQPMPIEDALRRMMDRKQPKGEGRASLALHPRDAKWLREGARAMSYQHQLDRQDRITARRAAPGDHMPSCPGRECPDDQWAYLACNCWVGGKAPGPGGVVIDMSEEASAAGLASVREAIAEGRRPPLDLGDADPTAPPPPRRKR